MGSICLSDLLSRFRVRAEGLGVFGGKGQGGIRV